MTVTMFNTTNVIYQSTVIKCMDYFLVLFLKVLCHGSLVHFAYTLACEQALRGSPGRSAWQAQNGEGEGEGEKHPYPTPRVL